LYTPIPIDLLPLATVIGAGMVLTVRAGLLAVRRDRARGRYRPPAGRPPAGRLTAKAAGDRSQGAYLQQDPYTASFGASLLDIELETLGVLRQLDGLAARNGVRLEIAMQQDLAVRADPRGFRLALLGILENAIGHTPCGKVLVGGARHGGCIQIAVLDDGQGPERLVQEAALRPVERIVALHGGTLQVDTRPGRGTMVILRLPEPVMPPVAPTVAQAAGAATPAVADPSASWGETEPVGSE